ncbi:MAG: hypothetical protein H6917_05210 [Novosphingobium sp.]|nr:hypothetical protein [Novosphingobium sp.]MCP5401769.1 hypothetical protein [Novosphingobium sp.]
MADHAQRTSRKQQPISRHPLFPATVALWFGALFGLGSMAVRPALIESAILAAHLDTLVPAIAPPLGMTTRILLALAMAGIGGLIGAAVARRIAQPRSAAPQRKRSATTISDLDEKTHRPKTEYLTPDPLDFGTGDDMRETPSVSPIRRRALAIEQEAETGDFQEHAPLPGGAPQIFNVSESGLERLENAPQTEDEVVDVADEGALDLSSFEYDGSDTDASSSGDMGDEAEPVAAEAETVREGPVAMPAEYTEHRRFDAPEAEPDVDEQVPDEPSPAGGRLFEEPTSFTPPVDEESFAPSPAETDELANPHFQSVVETSDQWSASEDPAPEPVSDFQTPEMQSEPIEEQSAPDSVPDSDDAQWHFAAEAAEDLDQLGESPLAEETDAVPVPEGSAAERIASANLDELSHVELLERLALSLERRRQRQASERDTPDPAMDDLDAAQPAIPELFVPEMVSLAPASDIPSAMADAEQEASVPEDGAFGPETIHADAEPDLTLEEGPPPPVSIPAALRPIGVDEDEFEEGLPSIVVHRHLAMPSAETAPTSDEASSHDDCEKAENVAAASDGLGPDTLDEDSRVLEEGYSSLLNLKRPPQEKQPFVRIDEPEPEDTAIEPVVIFPGHAPTGSDAPPAAPDAASADDQREREPAGEGRPFDAPGAAAEQDRPVKAASAKSQDPEETEKALRAALATLQRMSGAA